MVWAMLKMFDMSFMSSVSPLLSNRFSTRAVHALPI